MFRSQRISDRVGLAPLSESRDRHASHSRRWAVLQLECLEERVVPAAPDLSLITLLPGNAVIPASTSSQTVPISVQVTSPLGPINLGSVGVELLVNGQPVTVGTANVSNGQATVSLPIPGGLLAGTYTLVEELLNGTSLLASSPGSLTVTGTGGTGGSTSSGGGGSSAGSGGGSGAAGQSAFQAAIEVAIDTAAILLQGNAAAEEGLQVASQVFLNQPLPSNLLGDLLAHIGPAEGLALFGIAVGIDYADNVMNSSS